MNKYLSLPEAARAMSVSVNTLKTWVADGVFPDADAVIGEGAGSARRYGWTAETVHEWARDNLPLNRRLKG